MMKPSDIFTGVAEKLYFWSKAGAGPQPLDENGRPRLQLSGVFGRYLEKQDQARIAGLRRRIARTDMGRAMLDYIGEHKIAITLDRSMGDPDKGGVGGSQRDHIYLNPLSSDDALISFMAHETSHHEWTRKKKTLDLPDVDFLSPEGAVGWNRVFEAGAFNFQQKFVEDFAARTGDGGPLAAARKADICAPATCRTEADRFEWHVGRLVEDGTYDLRQMGSTSWVLEEREKNKAFAAETPLLSRKQSAAAVLALARGTDDGNWPFSPASHYLAGKSDRDILAAVMAPMRPTGMDDKLAKVYAGYERQLAAQQALTQPPRTPPWRRV